MSATIAEQSVYTLEIVKEEEIAAPIDVVFETILEQMGPENETPEKKMPMVLEAWPGGRWYRDLGDGARALLGQCSGDQSADAAGDLGAAVYVVSGGVESAVQVERRERGDAAEVRASGDGIDRS